MRSWTTVWPRLHSRRSLGWARHQRGTVEPMDRGHPRDCVRVERPYRADELFGRDVGFPPMPCPAPRHVSRLNCSSLVNTTPAHTMPRLRTEQAHTTNPVPHSVQTHPKARAGAGTEAAKTTLAEPLSNASPPLNIPQVTAEAHAPRHRYSPRPVRHASPLPSGIFIALTQGALRLITHKLRRISTTSHRALRTPGSREPAYKTVCFIFEDTFVVSPHH